MRSEPDVLTLKKKKNLWCPFTRLSYDQLCATNFSSERWGEEWGDKKRQIDSDLMLGDIFFLNILTSLFIHCKTSSPFISGENKKGRQTSMTVKAHDIFFNGFLDFYISRYKEERSVILRQTYFETIFYYLPHTWRHFYVSLFSPQWNKAQWQEIRVRVYTKATLGCKPLLEV